MTSSSLSFSPNTTVMSVYDLVSWSSALFMLLIYTSSNPVLFSRWPWKHLQWQSVLYNCVIDLFTGISANNLFQLICHEFCPCYLQIFLQIQAYPYSSHFVEGNIIVIYTTANGVVRDCVVYHHMNTLGTNWPQLETNLTTGTQCEILQRVIGIEITDVLLVQIFQKL